MYRDQRLALTVRVESSERELAQQRDRAEQAELALRKVERRLERLRDGVAEEDSLDESGFSRISKLLVLVAGLGVVAAVGGAATFGGAYFPDPHISLQGVRNLWWTIQHGEGWLGVVAAGLIVFAMSPWIIVPWKGARGLARRQTWGWATAVLGCVMWLPTPAFPVSLYVLQRLFRGQTRRVFFSSLNGAHVQAPGQAQQA